MTLLEIESRPIDSARPTGSVAVRDRDWLTTPAPPAAPAARPPSVPDSVLTLVTVAIRTTGDADAGEPEDEEEFEELAAARFRLTPLPRLDELELTVVQTDSGGTVQRWSGPSAAGAGVPTGPGAILHLQPAASQHSAAVERHLAIQADRDRRPSREGFCRHP
jgi:hypothetical protein